MTFEDTDTRAPETAADETSAPVRRRHVLLPRETDVDKMMNFVMEGEHVATQLRGLAALFRGVFCDDEARESEDASAAADIIDDVLKSMAGRLDAIADRARATRDHLAAGGAR